MTDEPDKSAEPTGVKRVATWPRLAGLALAVLAGMAMFALREAMTRPYPFRANLSGEEKQRFEELFKVPDSRYLGYSSDELHAYFAAIGPRGRDLYAKTQLTLDLYFPLAYGCLFVGLLARIFPCRTWWVWVPAGMAVADLCENVLLTILATTFDESASPAWESRAPVAAWCTIAKWAIGTVGIGVGVVALGLRIYDCFRKRQVGRKVA